MEKRKSYLNQKGFSLVELIIVIAIMAILVGVTVPVMIKFIEKSNVSSDFQLADTVRGAFLCAVTDARVVQDPASQPYIDRLSDGTGIDIDSDSAFLGSHCLMQTSAEEIVGIPLAQLPNKIKSAHDPHSHFNVQIVDGDVVVKITKTDSTGKKNYNAGNDIFVD